MINGDIKNTDIDPNKTIFPDLQVFKCESNK